LSKTKIIVFGSLLGVALISFPFLNSIAQENSRLQAEFDSYIQQAELSISTESLEDASAALEAANLLKPDHELVTSNFSTIQNIKASIENSNKVFKKAKQAEAKGKKLKALKLYLQVASHRYKIDEIASNKASKLQNILVAAELKKAFQRSRSKEYAQAAQVIRKAMKVLPEDTRLDEALSRYQEQYSKQKKARALSKMRPKYDNFKEITWYRDYSSPTYINQDGFFLYFGANSYEVTDLHLKMQYFADDWLFIDKASVNIDGETFVLSESSFDRDNDSTIWEWQDITVFANVSNELVLGRDVLEKIANSSRAIVRYTGSQYYHDEYISDRQKQAMRNVLAAYDAMKQ